MNETTVFTVYVVIVDWGTMDGYPHRTDVWKVFASKEDADLEAKKCKTRTPFPAVSATVWPQEVL